MLGFLEHGKTGFFNRWGWIMKLKKLLIGFVALYVLTSCARELKKEVIMTCINSCEVNEGLKIVTAYQVWVRCSCSNGAIFYIKR